MISTEDILRAHFPDIRNLSSHHERLIDSIAEGMNSLGILPNGGSRSVIFHVQGLREDGLTIVISPMPSFLDEQVRWLKKLGISAEALSEKISYADQRIILRNLSELNLKFLYVSPVWLGTTLFAKALEANAAIVSLIVIDQAHVISQHINQWGGAYKADYGHIPGLVASLRAAGGAPKILALTATQSDGPYLDIVRAFNIEKTIAVESIIRSNLRLNFFRVDSEQDKPKVLMDLLGGKNWHKALVFVYSRQKCAALASEFRAHGYKVGFINSLQNEEENHNVIHNYDSGQINLLFATSAYGTGIEISDIDLIVNYQIAHSIQDYYQMVGRGWTRADEERDCHCFLLWSRYIFDIRYSWLDADNAALDDLLHLIEGLFGKKGYLISPGSLKDVPLDAIKYARQGGILRHLYPLLIEEGIIEHLGQLPRPDSIKMVNPSTYWSDIQRLLGGVENKMAYTYEYIERQLGKRFEEVRDHLHDQELLGNIEQFPHETQHIYFRVCAPVPSLSVIHRIKQHLRNYIDLQKMEHEEFLSLARHENPEAFVNDALNRNDSYRF